MVCRCFAVELDTSQPEPDSTTLEESLDSSSRQQDSHPPTQPQLQLDSHPPTQPQLQLLSEQLRNHEEDHYVELHLHNLGLSLTDAQE
jgi:hypothetical protein